MTSRGRLLDCARTAALCQRRRYGVIDDDVSYLDRAGEDYLRSVVRGWFGHDDVDALTREPREPMFVY